MVEVVHRRSVYGSLSHSEEQDGSAIFLLVYGDMARGLYTVSVLYSDQAD